MKLPYGIVEFSQSILESILIGSLYSVMALGLSLTMDILRIPNLADAEFITVGGYTATIVSILAPVSLLVVLPLSFLSSALLAVVCYFVVFRSLERLRVSPLIMMVGSFGLGLIIRYVLYILANTNNLTFVQPHIITYISFDLFGVRINDLYLVSLPLALLLTVALHWLLNKTKLGKSMRALSNNKNLAVVVGVDTPRVTLVTWIIVGGLAGLGGAIWGDFVGVQPELGWNILFTLFAAALIGNFKFYGTIIGAFVLAFSENTAIGVLNGYLGVSLAYEPVVPLIVIVLVVLLKPKNMLTVGS